MHSVQRILFIIIYFWLCATTVAHAILVIEEGQQHVEPGGYVDTRVINDGLVAGSASNEFVFGSSSLVSGSGHFAHTHHLGIFAPGNSPAITSGTDTIIGGTIQIELGGTIPGLGSGRHDQFNDSGTLTLGASSVLEILTFQSFVPTPGDTFEILTWQTELTGDFNSVVIDPFFIANDISFERIVTNPSGTGNLTLVAVAIPEPSAFFLAGVVGAITAYLARRRS